MSGATVAATANSAAVPAVCRREHVDGVCVITVTARRGRQSVAAGLKVI